MSIKGAENDFYKGLENQLENKDVLLEYREYLNDYLDAENIENANIVKEAIIQKAFSELNIGELQALRDNFTQEALKLSGKKKFRMYELSAGISNGIKEKNENTQNNIHEGSEILNEDFPKFEIDAKSVEAEISGHTYRIWNENDISEIKRIGDDEYQIDIKVYRKQNKLVNYSRDIEIKFRFENEKITFFNDRNDNDNYDSNEYARRYNVETDEVTRIINQPNGNKIIKKEGLSYNISLDKKHISTPGVKHLNFKIEF